jgi:hypothetical protein
MLLFEYADRAEGLRNLEYRAHVIDLGRKDEHWVAHWAVSDDHDPKVRYGGGFLCGPYKSKTEAHEAAKRAVDENYVLGQVDACIVID